ncbi:MAG: hypothetical protein ABJH63_03480 [Rhizobiaceae bacterium]
MTDITNTPLEKAGFWAMRRTGTLVSDKSLDLMMGVGFALFVLAISAVAMFQPGYSFDMVAYLGAAIAISEPGAQPMLAWDLVRQAAPADVYQDLSAGNDYRLAQSSNASAFESVQPLYSAKIGYIYLLNLLAAPVGWIKAAFWSSLVSGLVLGLICLLWMAREKCLQGAPLVMAVLLAGNYFDALSYPGPDVIAAMLTLVAVYLWVQAREIPAAVLLLLAFVFRPDTLIFAFALLLASLAYGQSIKRIAALFVALLAASFAVRGLTEHPGWWVHYYFSNVQIQNTLVDFQPAFSVVAWIRGQARGVFMSLTEFNWPILLTFIGAATLAIKQAGMSFGVRRGTMMLACFLTIGGKFFVFPLPDDRLYMVLILAMTMIVIETLQPRLAKSLTF